MSYHTKLIHEMKERPILFTGETVRAILEERKTQTRRVVKPQPASVEYWLRGETSDRLKGLPTFRDATGKGWASCGPFKCPFIAEKMYAGEGGVLGNSNIDDKEARRSLLWVKETFRVCTECSTLNYAATVNKPRNCAGCDAYLGPWKPSIFMRREYSRITLEITNLRVERLQDISEEDAIAEGVERCGRFWKDYNCKEGFATTAKGSYQSLWESINGPDSWDENPWVWVIGYKRIK